MTDGLGSSSHKASVAVDFDDVYFMSNKGFHSVVTTERSGDFEQAYLSAKIQPTFNTWARGRLKYTQGTYLSTLNSAAWIVSEDGQSEASAVWFFNPEVTHVDGSRGVWFRWPDVFAQSITTRLEDDEYRLMMGNNEGRIMLAQNGTFTDFSSDGISLRFKTGTIYPDGNPQTDKLFKSLALIYKPRGRFSFTAYFKVDNFPPQALTFEQNVVGDRLGETLTLGTSLIGNNNVLAPFTKDVVGVGRGCSLEVFQGNAEGQVEIYGFVVEYETAEVSQETLGSSG
jgi:hypothetical protein